MLVMQDMGLVRLAWRIVGACALAAALLALLWVVV